MKTTHAIGRHERDSYMDMIRVFPLRVIRDDAQNAAACAVLDKWFGREDMDQGQEDYVRTLATLVADYQEKHCPFVVPETSVADRLKSIISDAELTQTQLAAIAGIDQSLMSLILSGRRELSKKSVIRLARHFHMEAGYFL